MLHTIGRAILIAAFIGFFGSFTAIALAYADYDMIGINTRVALSAIWKWPLFSMSILLTSLSLSIPFVAHYFRETSDPAVTIAGYGVGFMWLPFFLFYPGTRGLGVESDGVAVYAWFCVCMAQYVAAKIVLKAIDAKTAHDAYPKDTLNKSTNT